jgi:hypothetical protein
VKKVQNKFYKYTKNLSVYSDDEYQK